MKITTVVCISVLAMLMALDASAYSGYLTQARTAYPVIVGTPLNACILCHVPPGPPDENAVNSYGIAWLNAGLSFTAVDPLDSDGDVFSNGYEINHLTFPGDPASAPPPPQLTLLTPNGGESWVAGTAHGIAWTAPGLPGSVRVYLYLGWTKVRKLADVPAAAGTWTWSIPNGEAAGTLYRIRVQSLDFPAVADYGNGWFTIQEAPLRLTSPNGGESWKAGTSQNVTWVSKGLTGRAYIYLYNGWTRVRVLATAPVSTGTWTWAIPALEPAGANYRIRIALTANTSISDYSDHFFSIVP